MTDNSQQHVYEHIEDIIAELAVVDTSRRRLQVEANKQITAIQDELARRDDPLSAREAELMDELARLFIMNESWLTAHDSKTAVFRSGLLRARQSPGVLVVENEEAAMAYLRKIHKLLAFTRVGERTLDKPRLKKEPKLVEKMPGVKIEKAELLSVRLARTEIELHEDLYPYRRRLAR